MALRYIQVMHKRRGAPLLVWALGGQGKSALVPFGSCDDARLWSKEKFSVEKFVWQLTLT
jgi:hypothetical protein